MEVVKVLTDNAVVESPGLSLSGGKVMLDMTNRNGNPQIATDDFLIHAWRRVGYKPIESDTNTPAEDYMYDQVARRPQFAPEADFSGTALFNAVREALAESVTTRGKLPMHNLVVGQYSFPFRFDSTGKLGYGGPVMPYGFSGEIPISVGMVRHVQGDIPLSVDQYGKPLNPLSPLVDTLAREKAYLQLVDGASFEVEFAMPISLERAYFIMAATQGGYDDVVFDVDVTKEDGTVVSFIQRKYNYYYYGQDFLGTLGPVSKVKYTFKKASQHKGFIARNSLKNGKLLLTSLIPDGIPVQPYQYLQFYVLNSTKPYGYKDADLVDITSKFKATAVTPTTPQPAAKAGTSVSNLVDVNATAGWEAAAANQVTNTFRFDSVDPLEAVYPKLVVIEFNENAAYTGISQIVLTSGATNSGDPTVPTNTKRYNFDPNFVPTLGSTAKVAIMAHPNEDQQATNAFNITITENNATVALSIKSVRVFALPS